MAEVKSIEVKGKTLDEAIFTGLTELGLGIDQVSYEIIKENSKGLFGIGKSVVIRMTEKCSCAAEAECFLDGLFRIMAVPASAQAEENEDSLNVELTGDSTGQRPSGSWRRRSRRFRAPRSPACFGTR